MGEIIDRLNLSNSSDNMLSILKLIPGYPVFDDFNKCKLFFIKL